MELLLLLTDGGGELVQQQRLLLVQVAGVVVDVVDGGDAVMPETGLVVIGCGVAVEVCAHTKFGDMVGGLEIRYLGLMVCVQVFF